MEYTLDSLCDARCHASFDYELYADSDEEGEGVNRGEEKVKVHVDINVREKEDEGVEFKECGYCRSKCICSSCRIVCDGCR